MLVSACDWRQQTVAEQLPAILQPLGVRCVRVSSGHEATDVLRTMTVHIAVVDLAIPLRPGENDSTHRSEAGARLLQLLRRLDAPPPTIVIRPPQPSLRENSRTLSDALREGAFAVLDRPVHMEALLDALRRLLRRHYADHWPAA
jgi:CheY-like chemotaxis protein